ncbi:MAG: DUF6653 family protein [Paracoccaceae bacterium]
MDVFKFAERLMVMNDATWRRHANPWSGWTRMLTTLPLLCLAIWSRVWIGSWAFMFVGLALFWIWLNPRAFAEPKRFDAWMSKGVLGERIFIEHRAELPAHQITAARALSLLSVPGALILMWGLYVMWWEGVVFGVVLTALPKVWFVDRMVWVFEDWRRLGRKVPGMNDDEL